MNNQQRPVKIIDFNPLAKKYELCSNELERIIDENNIGDCEIAIVSIAGAFRKGKSFILNFFLKYLMEVYDADKNDTTWLNPSDQQPLMGFSFCSGKERHTTGIWIWSKIFTKTLGDGRRIGVMLMDTQGIFDSKSTMLDNLTIFTLTTILSSVQILNLFNNLQENDLQNLQLFTEYGKMAMQNSDKKPFQKLLFLIRDWSYPYECPYGFEGGLRYLTENFCNEDGLAEELKVSRRHIKSCYEDITCFLMPSPGSKVSTIRDFKGELFYLDEDFVALLMELVPGILCPENIQTKQIGDNKLKAKDLINYFSKYLAEFGEGKVASASKIVGGTTESNHLAAKNTASEYYNIQMLEYTAENKPIMQDNELRNLHEQIYSEALKIFKQKAVFGNEQKEKYLTDLKAYLDKQFQYHNDMNKAKTNVGLQSQVGDLNSVIEMQRTKTEQYQNKLRDMQNEMSEKILREEEEKRVLEEKLKHLQEKAQEKNKTVFERTWNYGKKLVVKSSNKKHEDDPGRYTEPRESPSNFFNDSYYVNHTNEDNNYPKDLVGRKPLGSQSYSTNQNCGNASLPYITNTSFTCPPLQQTTNTNSIDSWRTENPVPVNQYAQNNQRTTIPSVDTAKILINETIRPTPIVNDPLQKSYYQSSDSNYNNKDTVTQALQIVEINQHGKLIEQFNELEKILNHPKIFDRKLVVLSISGPLRKGKSFLMNFFLRYLKASNANQSLDNWISYGQSSSLNGFSWMGGKNRDTVGIQVWPEIFPVDCNDGRRIAIMLMDTQGIYDKETTFNTNVILFALTSLLSSTQIYNVSNNIEDDQLQFLETAIEYANYAGGQNQTQNLIYLVRDWHFGDISCGYNGGYKIYTEFTSTSLTNSNIQRKDILQLMNTSCFLMPNPGRHVTAPQFNGNINELQQEFINCLNILIPSICEKQRLMPKKINGIEIQANQFVAHMKRFLNALNNVEVRPKNHVSANSEVQNLNAISDAIKDYTNRMEKILSADKRYLNEEQLFQLHQTNSELAVQKFRNTPKISSSSARDYEARLLHSLEQNYQCFIIRNEQKQDNLSPSLTTLIQTMTRNQEIAAELNESRTKIIIDLINTFKITGDMHNEHICKLTEAFQQDKSTGFNLMDVIISAISVIPKIIRYLRRK